MKSSEMLRIVAETLWDGEGEFRPQDHSLYVCLALDDRFGRSSDHIREYIASLLGGYSGVLSWLIGNGYVNTNRYNKAKVSEVQAYRKAWCLHLAKEYEAKGD